MMPLLMLAVEANEVMILRSFKIAAGGPDAVEELQLMYREKVVAGLNAAFTLLTGGNPFDVLDDVSKQVVFNRVRLRRSSFRIVG